MREVALDGRTLVPEDLEAVARGTARAVVPDASRALMRAGAEWYARYGAPGILRSKWGWLVGGEPPRDTAEVVRLFVVGHCAGVGDPLPREEVRALLAARANVLAAGWSGVRPELVDRLLVLLDRDWIPVVPSQGGVGAAGSIQLAHVAHAAFGFGGAIEVGGVPEPAPPWIATLPPLVPTEKEALALLNGSSFTTALGALAVARARRVLRAAEAA